MMYESLSIYLIHYLIERMKWSEVHCIIRSLLFITSKLQELTISLFAVRYVCSISET